MKLLLFTFYLIYNIYSEVVILEDGINTWEDYKRVYALDFSGEEDEKRKEIFLHNFNFIKEYNARNNGVVLALNRFAHQRYSETSPKLNMRPKLKLSEFVKPNESVLPVRSRVDWRDYKVVTRVRDQGACGSCYAFSAVGAIESMFAIKSGELQELSEQEILDCDEEDEGCNGGLPENVFHYSIKYGLSTETTYEYQANESDCQPKNKHHSHKLLSFVEITPGNEHELLRALSFEGPLSIGLDANHRELVFYKSGILAIDSCSKERLDHGVLAVGYNLETVKPYIIIKNSWGENWGENGYFRMVLFENMCGIASVAAYPVVKI